MTTLPTTALIVGAIIIFMLGGFVGISIMALMNVAKEADKQIGADEGEKRMSFIQTIYQEMMKGNFSFAILIVGVIQIAVMVVVALREK